MSDPKTAHEPRTLGYKMAPKKKRKSRESLEFGLEFGVLVLGEKGMALQKGRPQSSAVCMLKVLIFFWQNNFSKKRSSMGSLPVRGLCVGPCAGLWECNPNEVVDVVIGINPKSQKVKNRAELVPAVLMPCGINACCY